MGYDITWEHMPPAVEAAHRAALQADPADHAAYRASWGDWWRLRAEHGAHYGAPYGRFERAILAEMRRLRMLYGPPGDHAPFRPCACADEGGDCCPAGRHNRRLREAPGPRPGLGIPAYTFASSDNWLVLPEEITAALTRFEGARATGYAYGGDPADQPHWGRWLRFMYCARGFGGFQVG